ncbi:MAG: methyl-accepting chemotaxis protein [Peptococcaceae bacterium]
MQKFFLNLKVSTKLLMSFALLTLITFTVGILSTGHILKLQKMDQELYTYQTLPLLELRTIHGSFEENRSYIRDLLLEDDPALAEFNLNAIEENRSEIKDALERFSLSLMTKEEKVQYKYLANVLENFDYHLDQIMELCRNGNKDFARLVLMQDGPKLSTNFTAALDKLSEIKKHTGEEVALANKMRAETAILQTAIFGACAVILAVILGIAIARVISTPLAVLSKTSGQMAQGNLAGEIPERFRASQDEIGQLGQVFHVMTANIRKLIEKVYQSAELVASSAQELNTGAGHAAEVGTQVAHTIGITAEGAQTQVNALTETIKTIQKMAETTRQVASSGSTAVAEAEKATQAAEVGSEKITMVITKMTDIKQSVEYSAGVVAELGTRSHEIGRIVSTISGLASQTNLLALNAAIEAARAGEEGQGFAVVAEEVRKLAEQSQTATEEITALIQGIQLDTEKAVTVMKQGTHQVKTGYEVVNEAGESFADIACLIRNVSEQIRGISGAVKSIADGSQHLVERVFAVEEISCQTSEQTRTISSAVQEQSAAMEEIAASCDMLTQMAAELQQAVSRFTIK